MSNRAREYRQLIDDVIAGGMLEAEEIAALRELIANAEKRAMQLYSEAAE